MIRLALLAFVLLLLVGCGDNPPPRGSAQDHAAGATALADSAAKAADVAAVDAARSEAQAVTLERLATATPTAHLIRLAADARVKADVDRAVAAALGRQAAEAISRAEEASVRAAAERQAEQRAADDRRWLALCRWIGLGALVSGALLAGLMAWGGRGQDGLAIGGLLAGTGLLVVGFGATITWLPLVVPALLIAGLAVWAIRGRRTLGLVTALSRTVDALDGTAAVPVREAKEALGKAVAVSGLQPRLARARAAWRAP